MNIFEKMPPLALEITGVNYARKTPVYLKSGDTLEIAIEGLGKVINVVQDETRS